MLFAKWESAFNMTLSKSETGIISRYVFPPRCCGVFFVLKILNESNLLDEIDDRFSGLGPISKNPSKKSGGAISPVRKLFALLKSRI
jgi:hypothetical protein